MSLLYIKPTCHIVNLNVTRFKEVHVQIVMSYPFAMLLMFICCNLGPVIISLLAVSKRFLQNSLDSHTFGLRYPTQDSSHKSRLLGLGWDSLLKISGFFRFL